VILLAADSKGKWINPRRETKAIVVHRYPSVAIGASAAYDNGS